VNEKSPSTSIEKIEKISTVFFQTLGSFDIVIQNRPELRNVYVYAYLSLTSRTLWVYYHLNRDNKDKDKDDIA